MKKFYLFIIVLVLSVTGVNAATKTWNGGAGLTLNWTTAGNWLPVGAPLAGDDIIFSTTGILTFTTGPGASFAFNSFTVSQGMVTLIGSGGTRTLTLGGNAGTDFTVASGASFTIGTTLNVTMANNATGDISGTLTVNTARTFNTNRTSVVTTVTGTINNSGTITSTTIPKLLMQSGSTYAHAQDGGSIPTATWSANATCSISGMTANYPTGTGQNFGHLTFSSTLTGNNTLAADIVCAGNLTISTGGSPNVLRGTNNGTPRNITVTGNFSQSSGVFVLTSDNGDVALTVTGDFSVSGGTFDFNNDNGTGDAALNVAGDFSHTAGTITRSDLAGTGTAGIVFNGSSSQVFRSGGTVGAGVNYTVNSGAILDMFAAGTIVSGNSFTLVNGGRLGITASTGIETAPTASGNIQTTTRTFNTGANYNYIGAGGAQVTGNALPATINSLTINNSAGLSLSGATTTSSASAPLTLTSGILSGALLTIGSAYTGAGGGGSAASHVNGSLAKTGSTTYEFPVGNGTLYRPIEVSALSASATITAQYFQANPKTAFGSALSGGLQQVSACEYWDLNDGVATITGIAKLTFGGSCNAAPYVSNAASLRVAHWNGSQWDNLGTDGAATLTSLKGNVASTFSPFTIGTTNSALNPLPVKYSTIKASEKANAVQIDWTAYQEENLLNYVVERSDNGINFTAIGTVAARNISGSNQYSFLDITPLAGVNFYRLRNVDIDSREGFSNIVKVNLDKNNTGFTLYPNPVRGGYVSFQSSNLAKGNYSMRVFNAAGQQVYVQTINHTGGAINQTIQLPAGAKTGMYSLQMESDEMKVMSKTFMVQ